MTSPVQLWFPPRVDMSTPHRSRSATSGGLHLDPQQAIAEVGDQVDIWRMAERDGRCERPALASHSIADELAKVPLLARFEGRGHAANIGWPEAGKGLPKPFSATFHSSG